MKICVYAICKDEENNVKEWVKSMSEADDIYVLDTGSKDKTIEYLKKEKVILREKTIKPWRFDVARNESLKMIPPKYDLYVCTDLDERFKSGWRKILEQKYNKEYTRVKYTYNWSFKDDGVVGTSFFLNKIHNKDYYWQNPVHEVLKTDREEKEIIIEEITLNHYQTPKNSRSKYLELLELSVRENPNDDRNMHYLGREYMYYGKHEKCIETLHKHLSLKSATWKDERSASMRYIARSYSSLGYKEETMLWYELAISEAPHLRENYVEYAGFLVNIKEYRKAMDLLDEAFKIKTKSKTYINEEFAWDYHIYELYSICAFYLNKKDIAKKYIDIAISKSPNNERLKSNRLLIYKSSMNN